MTSSAIRTLKTGEERILEVALLSDWGLSSGAGIVGGVDSVVRRDSHNRPYVTGTEMTGLVRAVAHDVAIALDSARAGFEQVDNSPQAARGKRDWVGWVDGLFGGEASGSALVAISPAHYVETAENAESVTTQAGVAINADGVAKHDFLRFIQRASSCKLRARLSLLPQDGNGADVAWTDEDRRRATILLGLSVGLVEAVGSGRNRGGGNCKLTLQGARSKDCAQAVAELQPDLPPAPIGRHRRTSVAINNAYVDSWIQAGLSATLDQPLHATTTRRFNTLRSDGFLRGTSVLAWVHNRLLQEGRRCGLPDEILAELAGGVAAGRLKVSDMRLASPRSTSAQPRRLDPVPLCLSRSKEKKNGLLYNTFAGEPPSEDGPFKSVRSGMVDIDGSKIYMGEIALESSIHTALEEDRRAKEGTFHTVDAIAAGQTLVGEIVMDQNLSAALERALGSSWAHLLEGPARLGGRRRSEYGGVTVTVGELAELAPEVPPQGGELATIWLTSDLVLPSSRLGPGTVDDLPAELRRHGVKAALPAVPAEDDRTTVSVRAARVDSYHQVSSRPRPSIVGLAAGSVIQLDLNTSGDDLAEVRQRLGLLGAIGIGLRTAEGYGRFVVADNWANEPKLTVMEEKEAL